MNPLYLDIAQTSGYVQCNSVEEKNGNKYLIFDSVMKTKKFQKNMKNIGRVLKKKLKLLMMAKKLNMGKIFKKI